MDIEGAADVLRTCRDCQQQFTLTSSEIQFYTDPGRGLSLPRRCVACRAARRLAKDQGLIQYPRADPEPWR
jgi:hypothetical protein